MPGDHDIIGEDVVVADFDIVGEVNYGHEEISIPEDGVPSRLSAAVNGDVFAESIPVADGNTGFGFRIEAEILRKTSDDRTVFDDVVFAHDDTAADFGQGSDAATGAEDDVVLNDRKGTDFDVLGQNGTVCDEGLGMDVRH